MSARTEYRTCPFCEATCGLEITLDGDAVTRIRGDEEDVLSHGFLCPKATGAERAARGPRPAAHAARARRRRRSSRPRPGTKRSRRSTSGSRASLADGGRNAVAAYLGNPNAHNLDALIYGRALLKALGTRNVYSASTVDQMPKQVSAGPDVRRAC